MRFELKELDALIFEDIVLLFCFYIQGECVPDSFYVWLIIGECIDVFLYYFQLHILNFMPITTWYIHFIFSVQ
jgi:hypothetical protein